MSALDNFLNSLPDRFDATKLLDADVSKIESTTYRKPIIYKYFAAARRTFFQRPELRFTQREALNDTQEMRRKWRNISTAEIKALVRKELEDIVPMAFSDQKLLTEMIVEEFATNGQVLDQLQKNQIASLLRSEAGFDFLQRRSIDAQQIIAPATDIVFTHLEAQFDQIVESVISEGGVLSLTEDPINEQMWAHYAEQGKGFVVGLKAQHPFFVHQDGQVTRHLLKKVIYTDTHIDNFWRNPYYLFLVKGTGWSYEREWRMFKRLNTSDEIVSTVSPPIHLWTLPVDIVETIHFGHGYARSDMTTDIATLSRLGANPTLFKIDVNQSSGTLEEHRVT